MTKSLIDRMDKRVTIYRPTEETDEANQPLDELIAVATLWAAIEPLRGREYAAALQQNAEVNTRIRIRFREGIDRTMVVKYGDHVFEILYVLHSEFGKKELQLMSKERQ
ncbi:phage head closure protein [Cohnella herbarum]|uniref:Phage head closure protein n=1 Tax=Cohnella herbarum TaxID=2728023 RepID=A0A7Z2VRL6_9BACL|nr:phage head closure protein [Cohnella herbarum]QJD87898.1 phage head closure protein [Cohnella herbarum]